MIDTDKLRGVIVERRKTQQDVAKYIGITPKTFYEKMSKGVFGSDEIESMIDYLDSQAPLSIFFVKK